MSLITEENNLSNQKLGLGYVPSVLGNIGIDNQKHPNKRISQYRFDIINLGTLRNVIPTAVLRKNIFNDSSRFKKQQWAYQNITIDGAQTLYEVISQYKIKLLGDYSYFGAGKVRFNVLETNFFEEKIKFAEKSNKMDRSLPFVRIQFPQNISNTSLVTGARDSLTNFDVTGINYAARNTFIYKKYNNVSGYLPYPNTAILWQYPRFNLDTVITVNSTEEYPDMYKDLNGLLTITLKNPSGQENLVYVSPHEIAEKYYNTYVDTLKLQLSKIQPTVVGRPPSYEYVKVPTGMTVQVLDINSKYYLEKNPAQNIFETGITYSNYTGSGVVPYLINNRLRQSTPLKDTWYYKFYSGLYSNNKTIATGTWDGVIPSGNSVILEYIGIADSYIGTNNELKFIYKNYGDNSYLDKTLRNTFKNKTVSGVNNFILRPYIGRKGFGMHPNLTVATRLSNNNLRNLINIEYNKQKKQLPSGVQTVIENSKIKRFRNLYTTTNYDYISSDLIPSGTYGCFKLQDKQIVCINKPI
jgi:hypothetical protein